MLICTSEDCLYFERPKNCRKVIVYLGKISMDAPHARELFEK